MYKINYEKLGSCFVVPSELADDCLAFAGKNQLKLAIYLCRHMSEDVSIKTLSDALKLSEGEITDAMSFWTERGIFTDTEKPKTAVETVVVPPEKNKKQLPEISVKQPTQAEIALRASENTELRSLFNEAQIIYGRTLGLSAQSTLLSVYDAYGMSADVIMLLLQYAKNCGKLNDGFILKTAKTWAEKEIDTFDKATELMRREESFDGYWKSFKEHFSLRLPKPGRTQKEQLEKWFFDYGFGLDMMDLAYNEMSKKCTDFNMKYMDKVLSRWYSSGIKTPAQAAAEQNSSGADTEPASESYNIADAEEKARSGKIKFKKKGEN